MCECAKPWYSTAYSSPATSCPLNWPVETVWRKGLALSSSCTVLRSSAIDTETPSRTNAAAALLFAGVTRFSVPSSSSSPQRPQFEISCIQASNSARETWVSPAASAFPAIAATPSSSAQAWRMARLAMVQSMRM